MDKIVKFCVYNKNTGELYGFYNSIDVVKVVISSDSENLVYCLIEDVFLNSILMIPVKIKTEMITDNKICINSMEFLTIIEEDVMPDDIRLLQIKDNIVSSIRDMEAEYIIKGLEIEVDGTTIQFKFGMEHQLRMKELIDNYSEGDTIWYSASDEFDHEFEYSVIKSAYKTLFNNKTYIHTYIEVFSKWITDNLTLEMYDSKENIYTFGYINDEIEEEVNRRYERLKLR